MAAASVKRPTAAEPRRTFGFPFFHQGTTAPDPSSPTNSIGSTAGLIYRDERDAPVDLLTMMPNTLRDSSPGAGPPQGVNNGANNNPNNPYPRANRVPPPAMGDQELDAQPSGISPANSLRRMTRENRGSSGSLNELGILPQDPGALGAARPSSRDRERRDTQKNGALPGDKPEARKASGNGPANGAGPTRPSPYSFDSTSTLKPNHSTTDLLSLGSLRDSPSFDNSALASLDPLQNTEFVSGGGAAGVGVGGAPSGSMAKKQGSGDSLELPNGEHGGWISYDSAEPAQRQDNRNANWDQNKANPAFTNSRFSPDRFPVLQERDDNDEEIISLPRNSSQQPRPQHTSQPSTGSPQQQTSQPRRRDLPIPGQQQNLMQYPREQNILPPQQVIPVPKTQHAQVAQAAQWTRRPSSPLAREPIVAQNGSSEESDSYTPRSPHATLPEIPSLPGSYVSNGSPQMPQQYQSSPTGSVQQNLYQPQPPSNNKSMPPPALVNRSRPPNPPNPPAQPAPPVQSHQTPMYEQHRGILPMYTGASMYTALSSISPSQSVSAVGSPHPSQRLPPGPPFGPSSSVFIEQGRGGGKSSQMYPMLQQQMMKGSGRGLGFSLDQQIAALTGSQGYQQLNSQNLAALKQLTERDLRAMGFGQRQPPQETPPPTNSSRPPQNESRRVVETLDKAAGEVVELQDLQRAMEMNLDQWDNRDWQHHRPPHLTGNSAQYPSSHAVLPPGDRAKAKAAEEYERQLQQLNAMTGMGAYSSSSHMHQRPGNPIPPTPFSATGPNGQVFPRVLPNGEGWIPVPNTDGYPPSYGEIMSLYEQHNPGKQPSMREVLLMQLAALASEPENVEGSVFSKSETPFPPVGYNPFIQAQHVHGNDSVRSSPRDPPGEFDKMLRRVGTFNQPPRRAVASSIFGGDGETEVSRMAPSTATEGTIEDDGGDTTEEDKRSNETVGGAGGGLRLNFDNSTSETINTAILANNNPNANVTASGNSNGSVTAPSVTTNEGGHSNLDLYPHLIGMLKSRAASVAPGFVRQMNSAGTESQWVEETDSDEDLEAELEVWGDEEGARLHPRFIRDEAKRRRKWEIKFAELVKAFHELDRLTDTPMILLATPPRTAAQSAQTPPVSHIALSRSIKRDRGYVQRAHDARQAYHNILTTPPTSTAGSFQSISPPLSSPPPLWGGQGMGRGWGSGSAGSLSDADAQMRAQMVAALGSLKLMNKLEERREERRRAEMLRQKDERATVERMLQALMVGSVTSGSTGNAPSVSAGSPAGGSVRAESVGEPAAAEGTATPIMAESD